MSTEPLSPPFNQADPPPTPPRPFEETPIEEMNFEGGDDIRNVLRSCGVKTAGDIEQLGCTGAAKFGLPPEGIKNLRLGIGGGGVGLPCFVPVTRYCLAHGTIGGLQQGQKQFYPDQVDAISRPLTPKEKGTVELIEASRRVQGGTMGDRLLRTADALSGRELPKGFEASSIFDAEPIIADMTPAAAAERIVQERPVARDGSYMVDLPEPWKCPDHPKTNWACRYCVAQAIVDGPLVPTYFVESPHPTGDTEYDTVPAEEVDPHVQSCNEQGCDEVNLYVRAARFTRRLAREE